MMMRTILSALLLLFLAGCQEILFGQLSEHDANEVLAVLADARIDATKKHVKDNTWRVEVDKSAFSSAVAVLRSAGVPNTQFSGLQETFKKQGLGSSPVEERARLMHAVAQELEKSIKVVDCVVNARVHINIPTPDRYGSEPVKSSVSILVKHRPGCDVAFLPEQVRTLATNAVENTAADAVSVMLVAAKDARVVAGSVAQEKTPAMLFWVAGLVTFMLVLGIGLIFRERLSSWIVQLQGSGAKEALGKTKRVADALPAEQAAGQIK
jgi:type III secretion protein J